MGTLVTSNRYNEAMDQLGKWIEPHPEGIYARPADAWVDPSVPKERALVTHGRADALKTGA